VKVVLDTNVVISGLLWRGAPYRCLLAIRAGLADLVVSPPILAELRRVLVTKFHHTAEEAEEVVAFLLESATLIEIPGALRVVHDDPDDDKFVETAAVAGATYIVTGDRHLLALRSYQGISVIGSRAFLDRLSAASE
jgi:putative PIN family toxin of toxin-antitoxin system